MRKTAVAIILLGLLFANCTLLFSGIDLLIDAVGFLLIWNGVSALQKVDHVYGKSSVTSIILLVLSIAQLFFTNPQSIIFMILFLLRVCAEGILCWQVINGFCKLAVQWEKPKNKAILLGGVICIEILLILSAIFGGFTHFSTSVYFVLHAIAFALFAIILVWYYILFSKQDA